MPQIINIMRIRKRYTRFTRIDLSVFFYCLELDEESRALTTIAALYGNYRYRQLPMRVKVSPDYAQALIKKILKGLNVDCYINDMGIWTNGTNDFHFEIVQTVLERIQDNSLKCNPLKCNWAIKEFDFLDYWMTPTGVKPRRNRIDIVL